MKYAEQFGNNLIELRRERGIGQVELARALHVSCGIISLWENGRREPTLTNLIALADFFEISLDELTGRKY